MSHRDAKPNASELANSLRRLRIGLGVSQLEFALRLGISQRHVSFVELGRSVPSRALVLRWLRETGASVDECNAALLCAGFAPAFHAFASEQVQETPAFHALSDMLVAHEPCPGIIFDADWMISAMTEGGQWLCGIGMADFLATMTGPTAQMDMIAAAAHPGGLLSKVRNAPEVGYALLRQLRAEQCARRSLKERIDLFETSLLERYGSDCTKTPRAAGDPYLRLVIDTEFGTLSFLLVQSVFGLPQNVTSASLRTELWFPTDGETRQIISSRRLSGQSE